MIFTTLIPLHRNDGSAVPESEREEILTRLAEQFGSATIEGKVIGYRYEPTGRGHYREENLKVTIACEWRRYAEAERAVRDIGHQLGQDEMYFEVRHVDGIRFLPTKVAAG